MLPFPMLQDSSLSAKQRKNGTQTQITIDRELEPTFPIFQKYPTCPFKARSFLLPRFGCKKNNRSQMGAYDQKTIDSSKNAVQGSHLCARYSNVPSRSVLVAILRDRWIYPFEGTIRWYPPKSTSTAFINDVCRPSGLCLYHPSFEHLRQSIQRSSLASGSAVPTR